MTNFVRLTADKQARRGNLWGQKSLGYADGFTATLRFRISGQGKVSRVACGRPRCVPQLRSDAPVCPRLPRLLHRAPALPCARTPAPAPPPPQRLFGDGLALFFTTHSSFSDGPAHGFTDRFTGWGIILDTFVNTDPGHIHKDILLLSSDGSKPKLAPHGGTVDPKPIGCDADFRYWEGRADFNVTSRSALRVTFRNNQLSAWIDARNTGVWKECFLEAPLQAPEGWWRGGSYLGLTASTGDLADNHDVLSLIVTSEGACGSRGGRGRTSVCVRLVCLVSLCNASHDAFGGRRPEPPLHAEAPVPPPPPPRRRARARGRGRRQARARVGIVGGRTRRRRDLVRDASRGVARQGEHCVPAALGRALAGLHVRERQGANGSRWRLRREA